MNQSGYLETSLLTNPIMREMLTHTSRMTLADDVNLEEFFMTKEEFSGADIKAKCTEVGLLALREGHMKVTIYFVLCGATECFFGSLLWSSKWLRLWGKLTPWWFLFSNLIRFQLDRRHKL